MTGRKKYSKRREKLKVIGSMAVKWRSGRKEREGTHGRHVLLQKLIEVNFNTYFISLSWKF